MFRQNDSTRCECGERYNFSEHLRYLRLSIVIRIMAPSIYLYSLSLNLTSRKSVWGSDAATSSKDSLRSLHQHLLISYFGANDAYIKTALLFGGVHWAL